MSEGRREQSTGISSPNKTENERQRGVHLAFALHFKRERAAKARVAFFVRDFFGGGTGVEKGVPLASFSSVTTSIA